MPSPSPFVGLTTTLAALIATKYQVGVGQAPWPISDPSHPYAVLFVSAGHLDRALSNQRSAYTVPFQIKTVAPTAAGSVTAADVLRDVLLTTALTLPVGTAQPIYEISSTDPYPVREDDTTTPVYITTHYYEIRIT